MLLRLFIAASLLLALTCDGRAEPTEIERAAARLLQTTVTLRIASPTHAQSKDGQPKDVRPKDDESRKPADAPQEAALVGVTVATGASLGNGLILTFARLPAGETSAANLEYRITLPDGAQSKAEPRVIDHYSGLLLLEIEKRDLPGLALADELPAIGGAVLTASAAGIEQPLVSMGVLSGVDRTIPGANLPPMVQCDVSTTEAASGAAVVDASGKLLGIVAATASPSERFGWSFAVPFRHIRRVVEARPTNDGGKRLVELVRRRPTVGFKLGPGAEEGAVEVEHVVAGGPAALAGIRQGELLFEAEGRKIRSAYQAVALILKRLPGDEISLVVGKGDERRTVRVTLGGEAVVVKPAQPGDQFQVGPQVNVRVAGPDKIEVRNSQGIAELSVKPNPAPAEPQRSVGNELELLRRQLQAYQDALQAMQRDRIERAAKDEEREALLQSLREEIAELKKQLETSPK